MSIQDSFNKGEEVKAQGGTNPYELVEITVTGAKIVKGGSNDHPFVKACPKDVNLLELTLKTGGTIFKEYQALKMGDDGKIKNYAYPRFTGSDGTEVAGSLCNDIFHAAKEYDAAQPHFERDFSQEKFVGLKLKMRVRFLDEGVILETDRQKLRNEQYQAENAEVEANLDAAEDKVEEDDLPF